MTTRLSNAECVREIFPKHCRSSDRRTKQPVSLILTITQGHGKRIKIILMKPKEIRYWGNIFEDSFYLMFLKKLSHPISNSIQALWMYLHHCHPYSWTTPLNETLILYFSQLKLRLLPSSKFNFSNYCGFTILLLIKEFSVRLISLFYVTISQFPSGRVTSFRMYM